ncbi:hypothetical protein VTO73DRAFT_6882 [Trametes versicolor]
MDPGRRLGYDNLHVPVLRHALTPPSQRSVHALQRVPCRTLTPYAALRALLCPPGALFHRGVDSYTAPTRPSLRTAPGKRARSPAQAPAAYLAKYDLPARRGSFLDAAVRRPQRSARSAASAGRQVRGSRTAAGAWLPPDAQGALPFALGAPPWRTDAPYVRWQEAILADAKEAQPTRVPSAGASLRRRTM